MNPVWNQCMELADAVLSWLVHPLSAGSLVAASMRELTFPSVLLRLTLSILLGGIIGLERVRKNRPAGFRTYMLVCMGAALAMILGQYAAQLAASRGSQSDMTRIAAQVINGVGFLGAGTILLTQQQQVKGLTTAAGLWSCAILGLTVGAGFFESAVICVCLILLSEILFVKLEYWLLRKSREYILYVEYTGAKCLEEILACLQQENIRINTMEITRSGAGGANVMLYIRIHKKISIGQLCQIVREISGVFSVEKL